MKRMYLGLDNKKQTELIDFSNHKRIMLNLTGAMDKFGIIHNSEIYIVKLDKENHKHSISEYIASKLAKELNIECQEVLLGTYNGRTCCALKYFLDDREEFHSYKEINDSSVSNQSQDVRDLPYDLKHIIHTILNYKNLNIPKEVRLYKFLEMVYFDALIGNFDRHWGNWGFKGLPKQYKVTPLFDNGSSLFPKRLDADLINYDEKYIQDRTLVFPTSAIKRIDENGKVSKYNYLDLVKDLTRLAGTGVLLKFCERLDTIDFEKLINDDLLIKILPQYERDFLIDILNSRYKVLLKGVLENETL